MSGARASNYELAYEDYSKCMKYKEIAKKYGVSLSAVKLWASRYWKKEKGLTLRSRYRKKLQPKADSPATRSPSVMGERERRGIKILTSYVTDDIQL